jgi:2-haloacid dehalogenase
MTLQQRQSADRPRRSQARRSRAQRVAESHWPLPGKPSVLVFDVNETLVDVESLAPLFERIFGDARVLREWFGQLLMYSMTVTLSGLYVDLLTLGRGVLTMVADAHGVEVDDNDLLSLDEGMRSMPAHPDVAEGLKALLDNGFRLVTLTNSPPGPPGQSALERAGLRGFFEHTFSIEACRAFKPSAHVYHYVSQELRVAPSDCMLVAAHVWDTVGAQCAGFSSALITRPGNAPLPVSGLPQPNIVVPDVAALGHRLASQLS